MVGSVTEPERVSKIWHGVPTDKEVYGNGTRSQGTATDHWCTTRKVERVRGALVGYVNLSM